MSYFSDTNFYKFLAWEASTKDTIDVKRIYIDMAGDLLAGIMLSQIIYWHLPDKNGKTRLRVHKKGFWWLAKKYTDWWEEVRLTRAQARRALDILREKQLVVTDVMKFSGNPQVHIRLNWEVFLPTWSAQIDIIAKKIESDMRCGADGNAL